MMKKLKQRNEATTPMVIDGIATSPPTITIPAGTMFFCHPSSEGVYVEPQSGIKTEEFTITVEDGELRT